MKRSAAMACVLLVVVVFLASVVSAQEMGKMQTATGEVISVDPQGTAITISWKAGKQALVVGAIVDKDTMVTAKGKAAALQDIKVGDTITIRSLKSDNLYAKEVAKR